MLFLVQALKKYCLQYNITNNAQIGQLARQGIQTELPDVDLNSPLGRYITIAQIAAMWAAEGR